MRKTRKADLKSGKESLPPEVKKEDGPQAEPVAQPPTVGPPPDEAPPEEAQASASVVSVLASGGASPGWAQSGNDSLPQAEATEAKRTEGQSDQADDEDTQDEDEMNENEQKDDQDQAEKVDPQEGAVDSTPNLGIVKPELVPIEGTMVPVPAPDWTEDQFLDWALTKLAEYQRKEQLSVLDYWDAGYAIGQAHRKHLASPGGTTSGWTQKVSKLFGNYSTARQLERCAETVDRKRASLCKNVTGLKMLAGIINLRTEYAPGSHLSDDWRGNWEPALPVRPPKPKRPTRAKARRAQVVESEVEEEGEEELDQRSEAVAKEAEEAAKAKAEGAKDIGQAEEEDTKVSAEQDLELAMELVKGWVDELTNDPNLLTLSQKAKLLPVSQDLTMWSQALEAILQ
jgi:hypothetical protein